MLLMTSLILIKLSVPDNPSVPGEWLKDPILHDRILIALNIIPFSGIAFLWFIGVVRDLIGEQEDKFFSSVFLGSGLIFVAMLFASAAIAGGLLSIFAIDSRPQLSSDVLMYSRAITTQFYMYMA